MIMQKSTGVIKKRPVRLLNCKSKAEYSEDLRLLYVALTRAESQLNLVLPEVMPKCWNALLYLLTEGEIGLRSDQQINTPMEQLLKQKIEHCCTKMLPETAPVDAWVSKQERLPPPTPRYFNGSLKQDGQTTSFTALHYIIKRKQRISLYQCSFVLKMMIAKL